MSKFKEYLEATKGNSKQQNSLKLAREFFKKNKVKYEIDKLYPIEKSGNIKIEIINPKQSNHKYDLDIDSNGQFIALGEHYNGSEKQLKNIFSNVFMFIESSEINNNLKEKIIEIMDNTSEELFNNSNTNNGRDYEGLFMGNGDFDVVADKIIKLLMKEGIIE